MNICSKMLKCLVVIALAAALIITVNNNDHSNAFYGFSSLLIK